MQFLTQNAPYVVLTTVLVLWVGISWYLWRLDARIRKLERQK